MSLVRAAVFVGLLAFAAGSGFAQQQGQSSDSDDAYERPYKICAENTVDPGTYNGYRRYHAFCHQCHGPDGLGSSYAPKLVDSLQVLKRDQFNEVVVNGRQNLAAGQEKVMPSFGHVEDVMMYLDDIYSYLKARSDGKLGRGRPQRCPA
ncbi:Cytochrome c-553I [bacterium HR40]|nr:Cytochrome c-553I [bacterium HR40]